MMGEVKNAKGEQFNAPLFANINTGDVLHQRYEYIPLDYIKTRVIGLSTVHFTSNKNLLFTTQLKERDEVQFDWCKVDNMELRIYPSGSITLSGSLHKFYNNGEHNYNDFNYDAFCACLRRLNDVFGVQPEQMRITNVEYGFNLQTNFEPSVLLNGLLQHKCVNFDRFNNAQGIFYQADHERNFTLKIYDKGMQYGLHYNCIRIEIKDKNPRKRFPSIITLQDLVNSNKKPFINYLLEQWDAVVLCDLTNVDDASTTLSYKLCNEVFWKQLIPSKGMTNAQKNALRKKRNVYRKKLKAVNKINGQDIQERVKKMIISKMNELQKVTFSATLDSSRLCRLTGIDISMQRHDSHLLSHKGLRHLYEHNRTEFERIKRRYLSGRWVKESLYIQIKEIAHNIRTTYSEKMRRTDVNQLQLFTTKSNVFQLQL